MKKKSNFAAMMVLVLSGSVLVNVLTQRCFGDFGLYDNEQLIVNQHHNRGALHDTSSAFIVSDGNVDFLYTFDFSSANVSGGGYVDDLFAYNSSFANISGGSVYLLSPRDSSSANVSGGDVFALYALHSSSANISGGSVNLLHTYVSSSTDISGGSVSNFCAYDSSSANISGGSVGNLYAYEYSSVTFCGRNFGIGEGLILDGQRVLGNGDLSGEWMDGTQWITSIGANDSTALIRVVPEPATLLLLGLGGLALLGNRKK